MVRARPRRGDTSRRGAAIRRARRRKRGVGGELSLRCAEASKNPSKVCDVSIMNWPMKMGNFTTIGANQPSNLIHILLDNNVHDSTGQQLTNASTVDFTSVAINCGYKISYLVNNLFSFEKSLKESLKKKGPIFINVRIKPGSISNLGRPTINPEKVARRFQNFLKR